MDGANVIFEQAMRETAGFTGQRCLAVTRRKSTTLLAIDSGAAVLAALSACMIGYVFPSTEAAAQREALVDYMPLWIAATVMALTWFRTQGHYHRRQALADQTGPVLGGCVFGLLLTTSGLIGSAGAGIQSLTAIYWLLLAPFLLICRMMGRVILRKAGQWDVAARLFVSAERTGETARLFRGRTEIGLRVTGSRIVDGVAAGQIFAEMRAAADAQNLPVYAPSISDPGQTEVVDSLVAQGVPFILIPAGATLPLHATLSALPPQDTCLVEVRDALARPLALAAKRGLDIMLALLGLALLAPVMVLVALAVRRDGGPALFRQQRIGRGGRTFSVLKFRSMSYDAEASLAALLARDPVAAAQWTAFQKLDNDPRVTSIGRFIRKTNIDELPQLLNVLMGDMSIVGPRPMMPDQVAQYGRAFLAYQRMRPGITGLWQTNGRNATSFAERARLEAFYVRNWSLWRDTVILFRTIRELANPTGR